jgi:3-deoxy-D-manno-octulosonate 8-phosphate phosphatase (KDO 8-P phosphatase)
MHYLFSNVKHLLQQDGKPEEQFYASLGFSHEDLFQMVTGTANPSPEQLLMISDALRRSVDDMLRRDLTLLAAHRNRYKMLVLDVDGVMTDGGMYYIDSGLEMKKYNTKDGLAMMRLERNGIKVGMLSHGFNRTLIKGRAEMLGLSFHYTGQEKKGVVLQQWIEKADLTLSDVAYLGDDINDLEVMRTVGFSAAPRDAVPAVRREVTHVLTTEGGQGCVRELAEMLFPEVFGG